MQVLYPEGFEKSGPDVHPTKAPTEPLYLIPTGLIVSSSKTNIPSTYSSATGSESISAKEDLGNIKLYVLNSF